MCYDWSSIVNLLSLKELWENSVKKYVPFGPFYQQWTLERNQKEQRRIKSVLEHNAERKRLKEQTEEEDEDQIDCEMDYDDDLIESSDDDQQMGNKKRAQKVSKKNQSSNKRKKQEDGNKTVGKKKQQGEQKKKSFESFDLNQNLEMSSDDDQ